MHGRSVLLTLILAASTSCSKEDVPPALQTRPDMGVAATEPPPATIAFEAELARVAAEYRTYGRVDDELRWAPYLCRLPMPARAHLTTSSDPGTHGGQKVYSLLAKDHAAYERAEAAHGTAGGIAGDVTQPVGQVIVKESFEAQRIAPADAPQAEHLSFFAGLDSSGDHFVPYARKGDVLYQAGRPLGLFIMLKLDPSTPGTDRGWVYGTVAPDGRVTSGGRVGACMSCHETANADRLLWPAALFE